MKKNFFELPASGARRLDFPLAAAMVLILLQAGCATVYPPKRWEIKKMKEAGTYLEVKDPNLAGILGLIPLAGGLYTEQAGLAISSLIYPYSVLWHPYLSNQGALEMNYEASVENSRSRRDRELAQAKSPGSGLSRGKLKQREAQINSRYNFLGDYQTAEAPDAPDIPGAQSPQSAENTQTPGAESLPQTSGDYDGVEVENAGEIVEPLRGAGFEHRPAGSAFSGVTLTLDAYVPENLGLPILMFRPSGTARYHEAAFHRGPDNYCTVSLGPEWLMPPTLEYYLVSRSPDGHRSGAFGSALDPYSLAVEGGLNEGLELKRYGFRHGVQARAEYVGYPRDGWPGTDSYFRYETEYLYRLFARLYSVRFGDGYMRGQGVVNSNGQMLAREASFLYSYVEAEFKKPDAPVGTSQRLLYGVEGDGAACGWEGLLRIGDELGANVQAGGSVFPGLGGSGLMQFTLRPVDKLSLTLATVLENLPLGQEMGYRNYMELGYSPRDSLKLSARAGLAARDLARIGMDLGLGFGLGF